MERMKWVVKVVFNDLLDWNDWFIRKRLKPPLMMVALGREKRFCFEPLYFTKTGSGQNFSFVF